MTKIRIILRALLLCLVLAGLVGACAVASAGAENGIPVVSITLDPEEFQKVIESPEHTYRAREGTLRIDLPEGYAGEFGEIDSSCIGLELPLKYIRGRGNSTWLEEKKPFRLKLENKANLLGIGKSKNWVLISNAMDNSLLRNRIMLAIARAYGLRFTPRLLPVDLYVNGAYMGSYIFGQEVRMEKASVGIDEIPQGATKEPEITGGYLLAMNPSANELEENIFTTARGVHFLMKNPEFASDDSDDETGTPQARSYITEYLQCTEDAVFGEGQKDPDGVSWTEYMDMESAAKYWWLQEICVNGDAFRSDSTFLYKEWNGKLYWGPPWDFDIVLNPASNDPSLNVITMPWLDHLRANDSQFQQTLLQTWTELDAILETFIDDGGIIDRYTAEIEQSWKQNQEHWDTWETRDEADLETEVIILKQFIGSRRTSIAASLEQLGEVTEQTASQQEKQETKGETVPGAQSDDLGSGISGTCYWRIDAQGRMTIGPLDGVSGSLDGWSSEAQRPWHSFMNRITAVLFQGTVRAKTCLEMFYHLYNVKEIDLTGLDTSEVTMMRGMFAWCPALEALDVSGLDTSGVTSTREMFLGDYNLTTLDLSELDLSGVTDARNMFYRCHHLKSVSLPKSRMGALTDMNGMFADCFELESLDLSGLDTSNVTRMTALLYRCFALSNIDLTGLDTSQVIRMDYLFAQCESLTELNLTGFDLSRTTDMSCMFLGCSRLTTLDLTGLDLSKVEHSRFMLENCDALKEVKGQPDFRN